MDTRRWDDIPARSYAEKMFTGEVQVREAPQSGPGQPSVLLVEFVDGGRTNWHSHPSGQLLHIVSGSGCVVSEHGEPVTVDPGDVVVAPPGEKHWHGALRATSMSHLSITWDEGAVWPDPPERPQPID